MDYLIFNIIQKVFIPGGNQNHCSWCFSYTNISMPWEKLLRNLKKMASHRHHNMCSIISDI